jgi:hypothetical protein
LYKFVLDDPSQGNNLEYQTFQDTVRAGIGAIGLVEAKPGQLARFNVAFKYSVTQTQVMTRRPYNPHFYRGEGYYDRERYGPRGPMFGLESAPDWINEPTIAYRHSLTVQIMDAQQGGKEVYRATAYSVAERDKMLRLMPYLVQAVFDGFPSNNGSERNLNYVEGR